MTEKERTSLPRLLQVVDHTSIEARAVTIENVRRWVAARRLPSMRMRGFVGRFRFPQPGECNTDEG